MQNTNEDKGDLATIARAVFDRYPQQHKEILCGIADASFSTTQKGFIKGWGIKRRFITSYRKGCCRKCA